MSTSPCHAERNGITSPSPHFTRTLFPVRIYRHAPVSHSPSYYRSLVLELSKLSEETERIESKRSDKNSDRIAKYIYV